MSKHAYLETADRIGARLCRDAVWAGNSCNWLGWSLEPVGASWSAVHRAQTAAVYDGTAGIAVFLARLYRFTKDGLQREAALGALNRAVAGAADIPAQMRSSVYSGAVGIAWAAIETGVSLEDDAMIQRGLGDLDAAASAPPVDVAIDVIGGSAGTIQVLLDAARRFDRPRLIDLASAHGKMLIRTAIKSDRGWSWDTLHGQSKENLCGYGHGAGGVGCALLDLWAATGDDACFQACLQSFRYERSHFSAEHHNWPDLRDTSSMPSMAPPPGQQAFSVAWCHGAPGIGLARLRALELLDRDTELRRMAIEDLHEALHMTALASSNVQFPQSGSMCLCHGLAGNADLLLLAAELHGRADLRAIAEAAGDQGIAQIRVPDLPWPCGITTGGETPNLMLGLAGIGHFYLRLYDSAQVPSVLLMGSKAAVAAPERA